jgi:hypothetical protein
MLKNAPLKIQALDATYTALMMLKKSALKSSTGRFRRSVHTKMSTKTVFTGDENAMG